MIKKILTPFSLLLLILISSCQDRYPDLEDGLYAEFVTNKDTMVAKLYFEKAPVTVANFVALAEGTHPLTKEEYKGKKYYNGTTFHRVIDKFMIQGGDPTASGSGDPGYKFDDEFIPELKHNKPGVLSMANSGPNTNGSQFFITEVPTPSLDAYLPDGSRKRCGTYPGGGCHAVFGELVMGLDVQDSISNVKTGVGSKPIEDVVIKELNIIRKGSAAKNFDAPKIFTDELPKIKEKEEARIAAMKKEQMEKAKAAQEAFLKKNEELDGRRKEFDTGLTMIFLNEEENGITPRSTDKVNIHCAGYFADGKLFYTTWKEVAEENGTYNEQEEDAGVYSPFTMPYNETATLVPGFREAMLNMNIGDRARVFIPSYLGYGESGRPPVIPPNTDLVFEVELVSIADQ